MTPRHVKEPKRTPTAQARDHIRELSTLAHTGDAIAFEELLMLSALATESLRIAYNHADADTKSHMLSIVRRKDSFPVLHSWRPVIVNKYAKVIGEIGPELGAAGPWKTTAMSKLELSTYLMEIAVPYFNQVRSMESDAVSIDADIRKEILGLAPLDRKSVGSWSRVIARWMLGEYTREEMYDPKSWIYRLSNPARQWRKRLKKQVAANEERYKNDGTEYDLMRYGYRKNKISSKGLVFSDFNEGLKEAIKNALITVLK